MKHTTSRAIFVLNLIFSSSDWDRRTSWIISLIVATRAMSAWLAAAEAEPEVEAALLEVIV
jgi:hypothetical protein